MKNVKSMSAFVYPVILSLLLSSAPAVLAADVIPFEQMNMETAPFSVPQTNNVNSTGTPLQQYDVGQSVSTSCTITGSWNPTSGSSTQGIMEFLANINTAANSASNSYYVLTIMPGGPVMISAVARGQTTVLASSMTGFSGTPNHFQLSWNAANPYTFTVVDLNSGATILTATDANATCPQGTSVCVGSNGMNLGTWSLSVAQQGIRPALPPIGNAGIVVTSFAHVNTNGTLPMAQHFGYPTTSCYADLCATEMVPTSQFSANQELGRVTCHRQNGPGGSANDYAVYFYKGQLGIGKTVASTEYLMATGAFPNGGKMQQGHPMALHIVTQDNSDGSLTITAYATLLPQGPPSIPPVPATPIVQWTDTGASAPALTNGTLPAQPPYLSGYQFGLYTQPTCATCWDCISVTPQ